MIIDGEYQRSVPDPPPPIDKTILLLPVILVAVTGVMFGTLYLLDQLRILLLFPR